MPIARRKSVEAVAWEVRWHTTPEATPRSRRLGTAEPKSERAGAPLQYQPGFGNQFVSEAVPGALPVGRNSPQRPPHGLYAELISGTSFTTARAENRRTWTYRIQPSVVHRPYARIDNGLIRSAPFNDVDATPTQLRWSPLPIPQKPTDFVEGIVTIGGNGDVATQVGMCVHLYAANRSMTDRYFYNADGEMLIVPQHGRARLVTELGIIEASPRRNRRHSARSCVFASNCRTDRRAAISAKTTVPCCACRNSVRSARMVWPMRAIS